MIRLGTREAADLLGGTLTGADVPFEGCGMDTRTLPAGALFVALPGTRVDGHDFVERARECGAAAALVSRPVATPLPVIRVVDTREALGRLAAHWRGRFRIPLVGVTGSTGKTTVKEMTAAVLRGVGPTLATEGNLNNDIGVPLTLARLGPEHRFAVVEMGANHPGEIAGLCAIARPRVGVVTHCAPAHLEGFGSVEGVARAKGELFAALPADGTAVVNADDAYAGLWIRTSAAGRRLTFGLEAVADVTGRWEPRDTGSQVHLVTPAGEADLRLALPGRHNVMNALAAAAVALALDVPLDAVVRGLESVRPVRGRLQVREARGLRVLDDTYNANPGSVAAALAVLATSPGRRWLVLGDMGELGAESAELHRRMGRLAREAGVDRLWTLGALAALAAESFGEGGRSFPSHAALAEALRTEAGPPATILVKGSRSMTMERVVEALVGGG